MYSKFFSTFLLSSALLLSGCYQMPQEDDVCIIPTTNNPDITRERGGSPVPGVTLPGMQ